MHAQSSHDVNRREFLEKTIVAAGGTAVGLQALRTTALGALPSDPKKSRSAASGRGVFIIRDPSDAVAGTQPAQWAILELQRALENRHVAVRIVDRVDQAEPGAKCLLAAGASATASRELARLGGVVMPDTAEAIGLIPGQLDRRPILLACGSDARGLVYALLELADRVVHGRDPLAALDLRRPVIEKPANPIRSINRSFVSDVEDKPWYYDRAFWTRYLSMLAAQRFNRFALTFGIGYDFTTSIRDCYFHFAYPFLVSPPGYTVRVTGVSDEERARNLETLQFISGTAAARGLHFQLGLWTHAYRWTNSPQANHIVEGLTPENHAAYSRDALAALLRACPAINGLTIRIHGESGVAEGSYDFWKTVFSGIAQSGRRVEIDMHAKGMDERMIDVALGTGMPVNISPKYWAEHMGLSYHQAAIRPLEMPPREARDQGFFSMSSGSRRFLRYGYGDLLSEDRRFGVLYRMWPGTQRLLLWGDPAMAAGYGRASTLCGSLGVDLCEPLSFKGRKGSGLPGGRDGYADRSLKPAGGDFEKYLYSYRLWGRLLYDPKTEPEVWRRSLEAQFGHGAPSVEASLASASRILPLLTTAHDPSAANNNFWPEIYTNMPIVDATKKHPYGDSPSPRLFGTVSPLDPELFSTVDGYAEELLSGKATGKYSPVDVAQWLRNCADRAITQLKTASQRVSDRHSPEFRRLEADVRIQSGLGRFFSDKLLAGVLFSIYERTGESSALQESLRSYRAARAAWAEFAGNAAKVYVSDITFGYEPQLRGHWLDRLPAIDDDIADMEKRGGQKLAPRTTPDTKDIQAAIHAVLTRSLRALARLQHAVPSSFQKGKPLSVELVIAEAKFRARSLTIELRYRHVNQAEVFRTVRMTGQDHSRRAVIPGDYTDSPFPLEYYFLLRNADPQAWLWPGFNADLTGQPYFVVRSV